MARHLRIGTCHGARPRRSAGLLVAEMAAVLSLAVAAGCSAEATGAGTVTSTAPPSTSSTTTTTTYPVPVAIAGTSTGGSDSFLGTAERVKVVAVPEGLSSYPLPVPGAREARGVERVGFRRFGSGPDLVLVTGLDGSMTWWEPSLLSLLAQHYRVTLFDLPGTGYSTPLGVPASLALYADETAGLIAALSLVRPVVLGWGLGGDVALVLAARHPESISSLVLVDTPALGPNEVLASAGVRRILTASWANPYALSGLMFSPAFASARTAWLVGISDVLPDALTAQSRQLLFEVGRQVLAYPLASSTLARLKVPVLLISGGRDQVVPPANMARLASELPDRRVLRFALGGFGVLFEYEQPAVASIEAFTG